MVKVHFHVRVDNAFQQARDVMAILTALMLLMRFTAVSFENFVCTSPFVLSNSVAHYAFHAFINSFPCRCIGHMSTDNSVSCMGLFGHSANKRLAFEKAQLMAFYAIQLNKLIMHSIVLDIIKTYMYAHEIVNRQVTNDVY